MNAYGIAVRSGLITPQIEDEEALRRALDLPDLSAATRALWTAQGSVRQPVTLKSGSDGTISTAPDNGGIEEETP